LSLLLLLLRPRLLPLLDLWDLSTLPLQLLLVLPLHPPRRWDRLSLLHLPLLPRLLDQLDLLSLPLPPPLLDL
jgi:hypothetical protein